MASLVVKNIFVAVDNKPVVHGVSFSLPQGKIFVLMGPNGSGKSSLALGLAGHPRYRVTSGSAYIGKKNLLKLKPEQRAQAGLHLAMQAPPEISGVAVNDFLRLSRDALTGQRVSRVALRNELQRMAAALGLQETFFQRFLYEGFSGGEKKRLELLELAILKPKFAILDEIDSGLDVDGMKIAAEQIKKAQDDGAGILLITHGPKLLEHLSIERVMVMISGSIVRAGGTDLIREIEEKGYG